MLPITSVPREALLLEAVEPDWGAGRARSAALRGESFERLRPTVHAILVRAIEIVSPLSICDPGYSS